MGYIIIIVRLFRIAISVLVLGVALYLLLAWYIPSHFQGMQLLEGLVSLAEGYALPIGGGFFVIAVLLAIPPILLLRRWRRGEEDMCEICGGPVEERSGRYGPYVKCLFCGKTRKAF
jgi:hypothetical protein